MTPKYSRRVSVFVFFSGLMLPRTETVPSERGEVAASVAGGSRAVRIRGSRKGEALAKVKQNKEAGKQD
jgi:hypothetical protein